jgi:hypothetical protein
MLLASSGVNRMGGGQTIEGLLVDRDTGDPVDGGLVLLLGSGQAAADGCLTGADGSFRIEAPGPGLYRLRAYRIGYETITSEILDLGADAVVRVRLETEVSPILLDELEVEAESRCVIRPGEGQPLARAWEEVRKALTVQEWAEAGALYRFQATETRQELDPGGHLILGEASREVEGVASNPVRTRPVEELLDLGFVRPVEDESSGYDYYGPDAAALLSDAFLDTHCFRFRTSPDDLDLIGLSFEAVRTERPPDIHGTLWLDRGTARLRFLEFQYDWAPWEGARDVARGRVEFQELPSGAWIIPRWWIRMPLMGVSPRGRDEPLEEARLMGTVEVGWRVRRVSHMDFRPVSPLPGGAVRGVVRESGSGRPLSGLEVSLVGASEAAWSDSAGRFFLDDVPEGGYRLTVRHPVLDSLETPFRGEDVFIRGGATARLQLTVPSRSEILKGLCDAPPDGPTPAILTGILRSRETGEPVPDRQVTLDWVASGFWIFKSRKYAEATTDENGHFRVCGFPPDTRVRIWAVGRDLRTTVEEFRARPGEIVVRDLSIVHGPA